MYVLIRATEEHAFRHPGILETAPTSLRLSALLVGALSPRSLPAPSTAPTEGDATALADVRNRVLLTEALEHSTRAGVILEHWLSEYRARRGQDNPTTVVFVDDLDRCSTTFATQVLAATNYWSQLPGHFFILGAEEERLKDALGEHMDREAGAPDRGLRKYVHVTVELSPTVAGVKGGRRLFSDLLERIALDDNLREELQKQLALVADEPPGPWSILEPLVNPSCTRIPGRYTPRMFKERFNALVTLLEADEANDGAVQTLPPRSLKQKVIELTWPDEWQRRLGPALLGTPSAYAWCSQFIDLGRIASAAARSGQRAAVQGGAQESGLNLDDADPLLAIYLASEPVYVLEAAIKAGATRVVSSGAPSSAVPERNLSSDAGELSLTSLSTEGGGPRLSDISELMLGSEADAPASTDRAEREVRSTIDELALVVELEDKTRAGELCRRLLELLPAGGLNAELAPRLGNIALRLANMGMLREAAQLHVLAMQANSRHANVNQNFVDFVIDHPFKELFSFADEALERLETDPEMREWRPVRTRILKAALHERFGTPASAEELTALVDAVTAPGLDVGNAEFINLLRPIRRSGDPKLLARVCGSLVERESDDMRAMAGTVRLVADGMAASDAHEDEDFGAELYRYMLTTGLIRELGESETGDTLYNYGVLLASRRAVRRPWYLFSEAYRMAPRDDTIRFRLARAFKENDDSNTAERLVAGVVSPTELPAPPGPPFSEPLPDRSVDAQRWLADHVVETNGEPLLEAFFQPVGEEAARRDAAGTASA